GIEQVLAAREAVALVLVETVLAHPAPAVDRLVDLFGLLGRAARIVLARDEEDRRLDLVHEEDGRAIAISRRVLDRVAHRAQVVLARLRVLVLYLGEPVDEGEERAARGPQVGLLGDGRHREVAAVRSAIDRDLPGIDVTRSTQEVDRARAVLEVAAAHV